MSGSGAAPATSTPGIASPIAWMTTIARHAAIDMVRRGAERVSAAGDGIDADLAERLADPASRGEMARDRRPAPACLDRPRGRPARHGAAGLLLRLEPRGTGGRFDRPVATVKTILRRSLIAVEGMPRWRDADRDELDALAGEYVLGTLAGRRASCGRGPLCGRRRLPPRGLRLGDPPAAAGRCGRREPRRRRACSTASSPSIVACRPRRAAAATSSCCAARSAAGGSRRRSSAPRRRSLAAVVVVERTAPRAADRIRRGADRGRRLRRPSSPPSMSQRAPSRSAASPRPRRPTRATSCGRSRRTRRRSRSASSSR